MCHLWKKQKLLEIKRRQKISTKMTGCVFMIMEVSVNVTIIWWRRSKGEKQKSWWKKNWRKKVVVVTHYDKTKGFKKKIDLHQKNVQLLSTVHEFYKNFILVEKSCAFKCGMFLSLICDQMSSSYFIPVVLPYHQLIDRDKPVFEKLCDPVMIVFKSNTVPHVSLLLIIINY